ncbi:MAG: hypothetical protein Q9214_004001, partial [Letrouitia sp. 1 TL-2023]
MAHDEVEAFLSHYAVFAGPISESVPSSVTGFAHRDSRADSVTSFTYFQENGAFPKWTEDEEAIEESDEEVSIESANSEISDSMPVSPKTGRLSVTSITSVEDPLLRRHDSARTEASAFQSSRKNSQKIYLKAEDLTIAISGFTTVMSAKAFHPFYVFQVASLILWSLDDYYYYAACIFLISVISIITTLIETRSVRHSNLSMTELTIADDEETQGTLALRMRRRHVISTELVPGDVYEVSDPSLTQFPSDGVLLAGDCIVNESMLTGESVPVSKAPISDKLLQQLESSSGSIVPEIAKSFLYSGTKIIRARRPQDGQDEEAVALGLIVRTGFNTTKGALVRSMLFPKPSGFKFYEDAFRYISVMAGVAGVGFIASLFNFIRLNVKVNVGGKLDIVCFDKTGTLTEDGLDVLGVRVVHQKTMRFGDMLCDASSMLPNATYIRDPVTDFQTCKAALYTMATCHSLRLVGAELLGDPMDLKMFEFTGWSFDEFQAQSLAVPGQGRNNIGASVARPPIGVNFTNDNTDRSSP